MASNHRSNNKRRYFDDDDDERRNDATASAAHHPLQNNKKERLVLLLDLDCFYAQAMCIRYGFNPQTTPLALLQWNSVLAVTYPARKLYNIQRGDSWDIVRQKSNAQCYCVHVPILTTKTTYTTTTASTTTTATIEDESTTTTTTNASCCGSDSPDDDRCGDNKSRVSTKSTVSPQVSMPSSTASSTSSASTTTAPERTVAATTSKSVGTVTVTTSSVNEEYQQWYCLTEEQRIVARKQEMGIRKYSSQGKACIDCFRIASAQIFAVVQQFLQQQQQQQQQQQSSSSTTTATPAAILERASIDEFFLDVTASVDDLVERESNTHPPLNDQTTTTEALEHTVIIGDKVTNADSDSLLRDEDIPERRHAGTNDPSRRRFHASCAIAYRIRKAVYDQLGFTMSAGIGINKTLAKLAVSYGKPNGQAICYPESIEYILDNTKIKSCRNLGGKLGSVVQKLLPSHVPMTIGSIARFLSLPELQQGIGGDMALAQKVYDIARGVDHEPVESKMKSSTTAVLTKSITAFKSLNFAPHPPGGQQPGKSDNNNTSGEKTRGHSVTEAIRWIQLLAQDIVSRVERDFSRHDRYPRSCSIQYALVEPHPNYSNKSIRIAFPPSRLTYDEKIAELVTNVTITIRSKYKGVDVRLLRVGLCATDFESRGSNNNNSIDSYFSAASSAASVVPTTHIASTTAATAAIHKKVKVTTENNTRETTVRLMVDLAMDTTGSTSTKDHHQSTRPADTLRESAKTTVNDTTDLALARRLQATFDREDRVLQLLDKSIMAKAKGKKVQTNKPSSHRIDSFFQKK